MKHKSPHHSKWRYNDLKFTENATQTSIHNTKDLKKWNQNAED